VSIRTGWPPPTALIFLGLGGVSRVGCRLFPAPEESHGGGGDGEKTGGGRGVDKRERDETTEISRITWMTQQQRRV